MVTGHLLYLLSYSGKPHGLTVGATGYTHGAASQVSVSVARLSTTIEKKSGRGAAGVWLLCVYFLPIDKVGKLYQILADYRAFLFVFW